MKLENMTIESYMDEYAENEPSLNFIISKTPRKREVRFLAKLILRGAKQTQDNYLYEYNHVPTSNGYHVITYICNNGVYADGTSVKIGELSKFGQAFGITNKMLEEEMEHLIPKGDIKLGNAVLRAVSMGPFEGGMDGKATLRLSIQDRKGYREEKAKEEEEAQVDALLKESIEAQRKAQQEENDADNREDILED